MKAKSRQQIERDEEIYQLTTLVAGEFSLPEVLDQLAEAAVKIVRVKACSIRLLDAETNDLKMRSSFGLSETYQNKGVVSKTDPVIKQAFSGQAVVVDDMRVDSRVRYREAATKECLVSQLTVSMTFRNKPIGVLRLYSPQPKHFDEDDINLARAVASQCAVAITNARLYGQAIEGARMTEQMRLAGLIQRRMIPEQTPDIPGLDIAATYIPCFDVGGDFYDFIPLGPRRLAIVIADVIGKGMPAAMMMSWLRGTVHTYIKSFAHAQHTGDVAWDEKPTDVNVVYTHKAVHRLNHIACHECQPGEFITLYFAIVDCDTETLTYCSCGHEPTVLIREDQCTDLDVGGLVLGVDPQAEYQIACIPLQSGDGLVFYTDGLIDAVNFDGEFWSRQSMVRAAREGIMCSAEHTVGNILRYRRRFVGLARQIDDTSIIVVKIVS